MNTLLNLIGQVIHDMDHYGVCVVDNLLGVEQGQNILREVYALERSGSFQDGKVMKQLERREASGENFRSSLLKPSQPVRGDKIAWVDGREPFCENIAVLISLIDAIVMGANKIPNSGKLGRYTIKERTKVNATFISAVLYFIS